LTILPGTPAPFLPSSPTHEVDPVADVMTARNRNPFFVLCGVLLVIAFLYWAQKVLIPVALAVLLAFVLTPAVSALQRRRLGRVPSVIVVTFLLFLVLAGIGWIVSQQIASLVSRLPSYQGELNRKIESLRSAGEGGFFSAVQHAIKSITDQLVDVPTGAADQPLPPAGTTPERPMYVMTAATGWSRALGFAGPAGEVLASGFLVIILLFFMLIQREKLRNRIVRLIGQGHLALTTKAIDEGSRRISRYLLMLAEINLAFGTLLGVGLFVLGLLLDAPGHPALRTTAVLWGFLGGVLRFVPYLGTWLAAAIILMFSVATLPGWWAPLFVFGYFCLLELILANVVEPILFGHTTGSSPTALLFAAAFWTWLWGPVGLILSTPLTVILVVLGKYVPPLRFFEVLLGDEPVLSPDMTYYQRLVAQDQDEASDLVDEYLEKHGLDELCEKLLVPAILHARRDHERGDIDAETLRTVYQSTRDIFFDIVPAPEPSAEDSTTLIGCPARDEGEELILHFLAAMVRTQNIPARVLSSKMLAAEMVEFFTGHCSPVVCIATAAPGGIAQARYLCKRLHSYCEGSKVVVARCGHDEESDRLRQRLKTAGADNVALSLAECRSMIVPLLQTARARVMAESAKLSPQTVGAH
jgi:predicted PurR-regulated permease PerM